METDCIPILYGLLKKKSCETGEEAGHSLIHLPESTEATQSRGKADERKREEVVSVGCLLCVRLHVRICLRVGISLRILSADCLIYSVCDSG